MTKFEQGEQVRVDIPDQSDPDHERYHGKHGTVISVLTDDLPEITAQNADSPIYKVEFESEETMDFRGHDLRPPIN